VHARREQTYFTVNFVRPCSLPFTLPLRSPSHTTTSFASSAAAIVTSEHEAQTCGVCSESHLKDNT